MLELIMVRHGETDSNLKGTYLGWTDTELNKTGIKQAEELKLKLRGNKIDRIFSSPLKRTLQTAHIINGEFGLHIEEVDALKERNFGIWDNLTGKEILTRYPQEYKTWTNDWINYSIPEGESAAESYNRITNFAEKLMEENVSCTFLLVTHLGCIRMIIAFLLGMGIEGLWRFTTDNCGVTRLTISDERYAYLTMLNG